MKLRSFLSLRSVLLSVVLASSLAACSDPEERVATYMQRGVQQFEAGKYEAARVEFKNALQINGTNGAAYYYLGRLYDAQHMWPEAMKAYVTAVAQAPDHEDANIQLGRYLVLGGDNDRALALAEHVIEITGGKSAEGYALRASVVLAQGNLDQAEADARHALEVDAANITASGVLAGALRQKGLGAQALAALDDGIAKNPKDATLRLAKIGFLIEQDKRPEIEKEWTGLLGIDPTNLAYRVSLARLYLTWNRVDEAEAVLRQQIELEPKSVDAKLTLADFIAVRRSTELARGALTAFIAESPKEPRYRFALAEMFRREGNLIAAEDTLREIVKVNADSIDAHNAQATLARLLYADGKTDEATKVMQQVLAVEPENATALLMRAQIELTAGHYTPAVDSLRSVLRNTPESVPALALLAQAYLGSGQQSLASDTLRKLVGLDATNVGARVQLAQILADQKQFDTSLKLLNDGLAQSPQDVPTLATKVDVLVAAGRLEEAEWVSKQIGGLPAAQATALQLKGKVAEAQGNHADAVVAFEQARAVDPNAWQPVNGMTVALARQGEFDKAATMLRDVVQQQPNNQNAWMRLGDVEAAKADYPAAFDAYGRAVQIDPHSLAAHNRVIALYYQTGNQDAALDALRAAALANPANTSTGTSFALALEQAGRFDEAIAQYKSMQAGGARDVVITNNLASLIADHQFQNPAKVQQAMKAMEPLQTSTNAAVIDTIGWLHYRAGDIPGAVSFLKRAVSLDASQPAVLRHLGEAYRSAGDAEMAKKYLTPAD